MKRFALVLAFASLLFTQAGTAYASPILVNLDGTQEPIPSGSPATGQAEVTIDPLALTLDVDLTFSGLLAPSTNAHIHCCAPPGVAAPVIIPFIPAGFITGTTSGTFQHTFDITLAQLAQLTSGGAYINIHSTLFPAGEIRGQIVPEPGTLALLAVAIVALALRHRARR